MSNLMNNSNITKTTLVYKYFITFAQHFEGNL